MSLRKEERDMEFLARLVPLFRSCAETVVIALLQPGGRGTRNEDRGTGSDRGWKGGR